MSKTILFLTTAHEPLDDRIFYHQAHSLVRDGFSVVIVSTAFSLQETRDSIIIDAEQVNETMTIRQKLAFIRSKLDRYKPDLVICSEPLPVYSAKKYARKNPAKVVYDITEWYPSRKHFTNIRGYKRRLRFWKLLLFNLYVGFAADGFIFGEACKRLPFRVLFPFKRQISLPYYPHADYIKVRPKVFDPTNITLCYTGRISEEKGTSNFLHAIAFFRQCYPQIKVNVKIIAKPESRDEELKFIHLQSFLNVGELKIITPVDLPCFSEALADVDICFDLRKDDLENQMSLPIKIFYYAACGKPVIYSKLWAIRRSVEWTKFGQLVNPKDYKQITNCITSYIENPALYEQHSRSGRELFAAKYNWELIEAGFKSFVRSFL